MTVKRKVDLQSLILKLFDEKEVLSIREITHSAGMSTASPADRRAIQRALKDLIVSKVITPSGNARARVYTFAKPSPPTTSATIEKAAGAFNDIQLSKGSQGLLQYVSKSLQARTPVGYNQRFLNAYEPNQTFYLSKPQRAELRTLGQVENTIRPAGTYARNILNRLLIDLSWNSSRLEGNTYSLLETKRLIELGESAPGKEATEAQMILNHKGAIEYIIESAAEEKISIHEVCSVHALLSENLLGDSSASGRLRQISVGIGGTTYMPLENPQILKECFQVFVEKLNLIEDPFEQSLFSLIHLSYLQAFEDVNKRTARLVANIPLIKENLKPLSFTDVDQESYVKSLLGIYEKNDICLLRDLYIWAYKRSSQKYSAIQQAMGEPNLLKIKYRSAIQEIIRSIILDKIEGRKVVKQIHNLVASLNFSQHDAAQITLLIETEILSLHEGNIARFKIRPTEYQDWKDVQG